MCFERKPGWKFPHPEIYCNHKVESENVRWPKKTSTNKESATGTHEDKRAAKLYKFKRWSNLVMANCMNKAGKVPRATSIIFIAMAMFEIKCRITCLYWPKGFCIGHQGQF